MPTNENSLKEVMADVFGVEANSINDDSSVDTVKKWDSYNHMKLVLALEERFNVAFHTEQALEMLSYPLVKIALAEHGVVFDA
jgi:acyl carrier protein